MIFDAGIFAVLGAMAMYAFLHFTGRLSAKTETDFSNLEQRIHTAMSQAGDDIVSRLTKATSDVNAALTAAGAAEKADHDSDLTNIGQAVDTLTSAIPKPPGE